MARVAVVTDSTTDLPRDLVAALGLRIVPLSVTFGDATFVSGLEIDTEEFYRRLATSESRPTTSQPSPTWFQEAYAACVDDGAEAIVSLHCSAALSGTVTVAREAARAVPVPVEVVDSRLVGGVLGLAALAAHRCAERGGSVSEVLAAVDRVRQRAVNVLAVDSLDHLRRGGRLSGAQAAIGTALRVKPLLHLTPDGRVEIRERTRTWKRALDRIVEIVAAAAGGGVVDAIVVHAVADERAAELFARLDEQVELGERLTTLIGPVVGAHVGPGSVGVAAIPVEPPES